MKNSPIIRPPRFLQVAILAGGDDPSRDHLLPLAQTAYVSKSFGVISHALSSTNVGLVGGGGGDPLSPPPTSEQLRRAVLGGGSLASGPLSAEDGGEPLAGGPTRWEVIEEMERKDREDLAKYGDPEGFGDLFSRAGQVGDHLRQARVLPLDVAQVERAVKGGEGEEAWCEDEEEAGRHGKKLETPYSVRHVRMTPTPYEEAATVQMYRRLARLVQNLDLLEKIAVEEARTT